MGIAYLTISFSLSAIAYLLVQKIVTASLPAIKRIKRFNKEMKPETKNLNDRINDYMISKLPEPAIEKIENFLYQTGQYYAGTNVQTFLKTHLVAFMFSLFPAAFLILLANMFDQIVLLILGLLIPLLMVSMPSINALLKREGYINHVIFQAPELIDLLEKEMVIGTGNPITAITLAKDEVKGDLKRIFDEIYKETLKHDTDLGQALHLLKKRINHPVYNSVANALIIGQDTGRIQRIFKSLGKLVDNEIQTLNKTKTQKANLIITVVAVLILINFGILIAVPLLNTFIGEMQGITNILL